MIVSRLWPRDARPLFRVLSGVIDKSPLIAVRDIEPAHTPTSGSDDEASAAFGTRGSLENGDEETAPEDEPVPRRKPGGYDSRIEQILYENPKLPILITDAGKSLESGGRYIVYTIRTGVWRLALSAV